MEAFVDAARSLLESRSANSASRDCLDALVSSGLPSTSDEVWRYASLASLDVDEHLPVDTSGAGSEFDAALFDGASVIVRVGNGQLESISGDVAGVSVSTKELHASLGGDDVVSRYGHDAFALMAGALSPSVLSIDVSAGADVGTIAVVQDVTTSASFSFTQVSLARGASARVVELVQGGSGALVTSLGEFLVEDNAHLEIVSCQRLASDAFYLSRTSSFLSRDARVRHSVVGLGGAYDRCRNDAELRGTGSRNELRTTYLGRGTQVHDLRTRQLHLAQRTESALLSKGAVSDESRSIYTGLIEMERGARRADARQTNHNLLLSRDAHADAVPNLDIRENDVTCSHASSVGPLDEMQIWYLESRGIARDEAQRLLVLGFFKEMTVAMPEGLASLVEEDVIGALTGSLS